MIHIYAYLIHEPIVDYDPVSLITTMLACVVLQLYKFLRRISPIVQEKKATVLSREG